jgi:hypothetical protein
MITTLPDRITSLPENLRRACERIFRVATIAGYADPPPTMHAWVERHFGSVDAVREQTIVRVVNMLTLEGALFNPLRGRRPIEAGGGEAALEARIAAGLAGDDIFREPERHTTADLFGRIHGEYCVTASNVAKCDGWHGLVIFNEPHPLRFGQPQLCSYLDTAWRWVAAAHARDPEAIYPLIVWNCLPKSGATQMHGHMQLLLGRDMPYARAELWRRAAQLYRAEQGAGYFDDLFAIHQALGLALGYKQTRAFVHLTPLRSREVVVLADHRPPTTDQQSTTNGRQGDKETTDNGLGTPNPQPSTPNSQRPSTDDLADSLHAVLRNLIDIQGVRAFNVGIVFPPLRADGADWAGFPIVARVADRGDPLAPSSDLGAIEFYATGCITADPFEVAEAFRTKNQEPRTN